MVCQIWSYIKDTTFTKNSFNMKLVATLAAAFAIMVLALQAEAKRSTQSQAFCPPNIGKDGCGG